MSGSQNIRAESVNHRTTTRKMPKPGEKNAPAFDVEKPEELGRFFERIEDWFADEGIENDVEKKRRIVRYLDADSESQWKALSKFRDGTFLEFKAQVMTAYPKAEDVMRGSVSALRKKIKRMGPIAADERDELLSLIRTMTAEVLKLKRIQPPIHTNRELVDMFLGRLTADFAARVAQKLSVHRFFAAQNPGEVPAERNTEDMYDVEEVMEMAKHTSLEHANPFGKYLGVVAGPTSEVSVKLEQAVARLTDTINLQAQHNQNMEQRLATMQSFMTGSARNPMPQNYVRGPTPIDNSGGMRGPLECFYCKGPHRIVDCVDVIRHLDSKWIAKIDGRLRLPDGQRIFGEPGKSMRDIVEVLNKKTPGIIQSSKIADKASLYQGNSHISSYMQEQWSEREQVRVLTELIQQVGVGRVQQLLQDQDPIIEDDDDEDDAQNFD
jgi:hypothetical protein